MVPSVAAWAKNNGATLLGVGVGDPSAAAEFWSANTDGQPEIHADPDGTIANAFGHPKDEQGKYSNLPMVMLLTPERKIIYLSDGYNLAVADGLSRAMELAP
jgi:peroxiredoxin